MDTEFFFEVWRGEVVLSGGSKVRETPSEQKKVILTPSILADKSWFSVQGEVQDKRVRLFKQFYILWRNSPNPRLKLRPNLIIASESLKS